MENDTDNFEKYESLRLSGVSSRQAYIAALDNLDA